MDSANQERKGIRIEIAWFIQIKAIFDFMIYRKLHDELILPIIYRKILTQY